MLRLIDLTHSAVEAYDLLPVPVWVFSVDSLQILASNRAAQTWLGFDEQTLKLKTIADLRPVAARDRLAKQVRQFDGTSSDAGLWTVVARSGDHYTASFTWSRVVFDGTDAIVASIRDMTRITRAEEMTEALTAEVEALRRNARVSAEHLSSVFDGLPGKMLVLTPGEYKIVAVTDEYSQAVMLERDALLGRRLFEAFPDDPAEPEADGTRNLRSSLQRVEALRVLDVMNVQRYPVRKPDGAFQERFWLPRNKPVFDVSGQLIFIIHSVEDVTEMLSCTGSEPHGASGANADRALRAAASRTTLLALQERETRLRTAEVLMDLGSWELDLDRGKLSWSKRVFEIYGVPHEHGAPDFHGYVALVHPDDRPQMLSTYDHFFERGAPEIEFQHRIIRADGTVAHVRGVGARHLVEGREFAIGSVQDITRFKDAEERLIEAARLQKTAGYMALLGGWRIELDQTRLFWSPETALIHDEPEGTSPTIDDGFNYYAPEYRDRISALFKACAQEGQPFDEVMQIITAQGRRLWVRTIGEPVRNGAGQIVAVEGALQDISELTAARNASEQLSRRLRETLESISDAFFLLDNDWRFTFVNVHAESVLQRRRENLLGKNIWQQFPKAVGSTFQVECTRAVTERRTARFQEYYPPLDARFEVNAYPTSDGLAVYFRDVTEQHARDEQLRLLESAVSRQSDILLITDAEPIDSPEGPKIVYVNDAFVRLTGFTREETIGQTPRILQGPKTERSELDRIRQALQNWQPVRAELINYTKRGDEFWLELDIAPVATGSGRYTHWVSIERNVTARKLVQQALQDNEERFRLVAKATGNAIWDWHVVSDHEWWSDGMRENFGHEVEPGKAHIAVWRANVHPEDETRVKEALGRLLAGKSDVLQERYRFRRANGNWAEVEDHAFVIRDDAGRAMRVLGSMTDISDRVHLEDRLRQAQKMEAVGQLTGGIAHDFNNLLTVVLGNAELLSEELDGQPRLQSLAEMTAKAALRAAELTDRLLSFSRKQVLQPRILDVGALIQGMEGLLRRTLPENIEIEFVRAGGLWKTEIDPGQMEAAVLNLVVNARDAMPGGGSLTIETLNAALDDDYAAGEEDVEAGQYVLISITDTGHGIQPDMLDRIFEPFFTTKEVGKGSGLGLSMVFGFVKQSRGHIRVYSEQGEGTSFKLYFPRTYATTEQLRRDRPSAGISGGDETILVVEDDNLVREHAVAQLKELGYRVFDASAGSDALDILERVPDIELLFTDVVMPGGMGGRELADAARAMRPKLKILYTSGYTATSMVHNGRLDPGIDLLNKPYRREELATKLRRVLDRD